MAKKIKFVDVSNLPRKTNNSIDWKKSIGYRCSFIYEDLNGEIEILKYELINNKIPMLTLKYHENIKELQTNAFIRGVIGSLIGKWNVGFKYEIGQILNVRSGDIEITNRYIEKESGRNRKFYDYICLTCNEENKHIRESTFDKNDGCPVCAGKKLVVGKNDIATVAPWMIQFFQGGEYFTKRCSSGSNTQGGIFLISLKHSM